MVNFAVDLRCLNYTLRTGVNTYALHFLYQLYLQKQLKSDIRLIGIGLNKNRSEELSSEFPFFKQMWDEQLSLVDYLGFKITIPIKYINTFLALDFRFLKRTRNKKYRLFDILFLPQPRSLPTHPNTQTITIFHDLYGALEPSELSWKQRIFDNLELYKMIADNSNIIWVNSIATGLDVQKFLGQPKDKIKLVYPALPEWEILKASI